MTHGIPYVRTKRGRGGKEYLYFDTGQQDERGKPILKRLPDLKDPAFGRSLARMQGARNSRAKPANVLTVAGLADMWEKSPHFTKLAAGSRRNYGTYLKVIRERIGIAPAEDVKPSDVRHVQDQMADKPSAANMFVRTLGSLYSWGRKRGHVSTFPVRDVELLEEGEHEPWPEWLLDKALQDEAVQLPVAMLYFTAQRIGDVCRMRWNDIHSGAVTVTQQKTGKALTIPLHRDLAALLAKAPRKGLTVLLRPDGTQWEPKTLRAMLQRWAKAQGAEIVPHGLRKNAVIALLHAGCSIAETAAISGQTMTMVEHYARRRNQATLGSAAILKWEGRK
jgi:integrase